MDLLSKTFENVSHKVLIKRLTELKKSSNIIMDWELFNQQTTVHQNNICKWKSAINLKISVKIYLMWSSPGVNVSHFSSYVTLMGYQGLYLLKLKMTYAFIQMMPA